MVVRRGGRVVGDSGVQSFSALSVEPYGGSTLEGAKDDDLLDTFSALSVEPYGGSIPTLRACWESAQLSVLSL